MSGGLTAQLDQYRRRDSLLVIVLVAVVLVSLAVLTIIEQKSRAHHYEMISHGVEVRLLTIGRLLDHQLRSGFSQSQTSDSLEHAFGSSVAMHWAGIIPPSHIGPEGEFVARFHRENPSIELSPEDLSHMLMAARACSGSNSITVTQEGFTLAACRLHGGDVFTALYSRPQVHAEIALPFESRWIAALSLIFAAASISHLVSRRMLHGPLLRLSKALAASHDTLEFKLDHPLPDNEIGWVGHQIEDWLKQQRTTEKELERMARVAQATESAIMVLDENLNTTWVNDAFVSMTGYAPEEVMGKEPREYMRGTGIDRTIAEQVDKSFTEGKGFLVEAEVFRKDGSRYWIAAESRPVRNDEGIVTSWICINTDITERKQSDEILASRVIELELAREKQSALAKELKSAKRKAERSDKSKSDFLADMSHEIRTPLNGVLGMADVLLTTGLSHDQRDYIQTIKDSGASLLAILNDILDFSKLEAGKISLKKTKTDLRRIISTVSDLMAPRASEKGLTISHKVSDDVPAEIMEDGLRLQQVLLNLVGNAVKFTEKGWINLSVDVVQRSSGGDFLRIEVTDTGIGITPEHQERLFARFEQVGVTGVRTAGGTGLGLSISQELTRLMDGEITLESEEDVGSTFAIEIPLVAVEQEIRPPQEQIEEHQPVTALPQPETEGQDKNDDVDDGIAQEYESLNILLAEDHPVNQALMKSFVGKLGHTLTVTVDGVEAVQAARKYDFDLILMDIQMPRMDGVMATKIIRSLESEKSQTPIIAVTANAMAGQKDHYLVSGMNGYVSKPVQIENLRDEIERVWAEFQNRNQDLPKQSTG